MSLDQEIRVAAFEWLRGQIQIHGDVLPRTLLQEGFAYRGMRIPLVSPQGIFKPKAMELPLSITTTVNGPYDDVIDNQSEYLYYRYRGNDPDHRDNTGLRQAMEQQVPLIYFFSLTPGRYLAIFPIYIIHDDPSALTFLVSADDEALFGSVENVVSDSREAVRAYITSSVKRRLHQRGFRERVLAAYRSLCAFCHLKHVELLDAAHIVPDGEPDGVPVTPNGLSLCKIHHSAFDQHIIGVTPDYEIKVRQDILQEIDGPMLRHGIQELHNHRLILPRSRQNWPDRERLDWRYEKFRNTG